MENDSNDSSDEENLHYLIATGILPGFDNPDDTSRPSGSQRGKRGNKRRDFDGAASRLHDDYFSSTPKYSTRDFERRFRMPRVVFERIQNAINGKGIFVRRTDGLNRQGIHPIVRITAALRMLAYGIAADALDEYLQMSEDSVLLSTKAFCEEVIAAFGEEYLREPTTTDLTRIMRVNAARGFPGCVGSIDCQHWEWRNCPMAWAGQFKGKEKKPTIVLEAICDGELWIWHAFFGSPGSMNDINILDNSKTMERIIAGEFPPSVAYKVNGVIRLVPYYLADGIYPNWAIFVKTITDGITRKERAYASAQEAVRKDIERAFGVLVARFHILQRPARLWFRSDIANVMKACIIIHNMAVEHRRDAYDSGMGSLGLFEDARATFGSTPSFAWQSETAMTQLHNGSLPNGTWATIVDARESRVTSSVEHFSLKRDLIDHIWSRLGI